MRTSPDAADSVRDLSSGLRKERMIISNEKMGLKNLLSLFSGFLLNFPNDDKSIGRIRRWAGRGHYDDVRR